ncbi:hypothetical protein CJD_A0519 [Clostridium perfringens D str. JGS1721]|uniref:Ferric oxidoreductase domain-containing protein n=1 Tax=Clostridium perfringens D str. JGS1721 TaxID=488537 RepID=B1V381_CLOPF|nr:hypothetical protein CJD_A0519 [Clostridium perfringens D str. JGS1721]
MNKKNFFSFKIKPINKILEKTSIFLSLIILLFSFIFIFYCIKNNFFANISYRTIKNINKTIGKISEYIFIFSISMFIVRRILKYIYPFKINFLSKLLQYIAVFLRQWHIPLSLLAFSLIILHGYIGLYFGIIKNNLSFKFGYYIGILTLINLIFLILSRIFKYNSIKKVHKLLGISFIILMFIHIVTI